MKKRQYKVEIYDAGNRLHRTIPGFTSEDAAKEHATRKREEIERRGWRMTVKTALQGATTKKKGWSKAAPETKAEKVIVFETDRHWVKRVPKGFEVYKTGLTHSTRVASIGYKGNKGLQRAKREIARREAANDGKKNLGGGWSKAAPKTKGARRALLARCGRKAFLVPSKLKFPVVSARSQTCEPDCRGLLAAKQRAAIQGKRKLVAKANRLAKRAGCHWAR
jgi:hypothetical protein